jgi:uracil DNA glycosylase
MLKVRWTEIPRMVLKVLMPTKARKTSMTKTRTKKRRKMMRMRSLTLKTLNSTTLSMNKGFWWEKSFLSLNSALVQMKPKTRLRLLLQ